MDAKRLNKKFFVRTWDASGILVAFLPNPKLTNSQNLKIADAIYNNFFKNGHLDLTDADTVYNQIEKLGFDYNKDSLVVFEFDKNDKLIENILGENIETSYEKEGTELRIYFNGRGNIAFTINLKSRKIPKSIIWFILIFIISLCAYCLVNEYIKWQISREENWQYEKELLDSIKQSSLTEADLNAKIDSLYIIITNLSEDLEDSKMSADKKQQDFDSLTKALQEKEQGVEILKQQASSNKRNKTVTRPQQQKPKSSTRPNNGVTRSDKSDYFKKYVDKGNECAHAYHYNGSESKRLEAISWYTKALDIKNDKEISDKLAKLKKK